MEPEDLITYCGGYGGHCCGWHENTILVDLAGALAELVDASGCHHWIPTEIKDFDYIEFRKGLDFFSKDPRVICQSCCKSGRSGYLGCEIRKCCKERGLDVCFECGEFPCDRVYPEMIERAEEYTALGKDEWLRRQVEKASQGYEDHTRKYYRFWVGRHPPDETGTV
jgi:hypothetical protein